MRAASLAACIVMCGAVAVAAQTPVVKVHIYTSTSDSGFVDKESKARVDAVKNVGTGLMRRNKRVALVDTKDAADVLVEVLSVEAAAGPVQTKPDIYGVTSEARKETRVTVKLSVGDYATEIQAQEIYANLAAMRAGDEVKKWITENGAKILAPK